MESDMVSFANLDSKVSIIDQLSEDVSPVVLVNVFTVEAREAEGLIAAWTKDAELMKQAPGFISTQLHRGIGESSTFMNYAVWESVAAFKTAFENPDFQRQIANYPPSTVAHPHLFHKLAVPGICVAG
jgi:heme-degrading monooxygenase HmoA